MDRERIEARCRVGNWAVIATGFLALSTPLVLIVEAVVWIIDRRWPTLNYFTGWRPEHLWLRALSFLPASAIVLAVGSISFFVSLAYWRAQERRLRKARGHLWPPRPRA